MYFEPMELEPIKAGQERLARVFSDEFAFAVPTYQRPYAWETEQASALLDDVLYALNEAVATKEPITYFLGSIVLIKQPGAPDAKVVDGQQRLTTLTILLAVLRDLSSHDAALKRQAYICEEADPDKGTKSRHRLTLRKRDEEFFRDTIQKIGATDHLPETTGLTDSRLRIVENARLFRGRLEKMKPEDRDRLIAFLLQRCYLVVIAVANVDMAHRVFTVLNARGLDLTPSDILKADLLDRVPTAEERDYADDWENLEERLGRERFVEIFQHIRMVWQREKPRERLEVGFEKFVKIFADHERFMKTCLKPYGETFLLLQSPAGFATRWGVEATRRLGHLQRLDNNDWLPVTLRFFAEGKPSVEDATLFMRRLETLAYFLFVTRADINERIKRYAAILSDLVGDAWKGKSIELTPADKSAFRQALDGPIYEFTRVRLPLLLRLDAEISTGGASYDTRIISVEHVLPQTPVAGSAWLHDFPEDEIRATWTHRLGNLVLLTRRKNTQASNYDFEMKKNVYFKADGTAAPFALTTQVVDTKVWTPEILADRQKSLLAKLHATWDITPEVAS